MYEDVYKNKKKETIILSDLPNINRYTFSKYYDTWKMRYEIKKEESKK